MSDLFEGLFELVGEAAGKVAEIAAENAGAMFEGTTAVASAVAEGTGPALAGAARVTGQVAGATARGVAGVAGNGLAEAAIDGIGSLGGTATSSPTPQRVPRASADARPGGRRRKKDRPRRVRKGHRGLPAD